MKILANPVCCTTRARNKLQSPLSAGHPNIYKLTITLEFSLKNYFPSASRLPWLLLHRTSTEVAFQHLTFLTQAGSADSHEGHLAPYGIIESDLFLSEYGLKERDPDSALDSTLLGVPGTNLQSLCKYLYFKFNSVKSKGWNR